MNWYLACEDCGLRLPDVKERKVYDQDGATIIKEHLCDDCFGEKEHPRQ